MWNSRNIESSMTVNAQIKRTENGNKKEYSRKCFYNKSIIDFSSDEYNDVSSKESNYH